MSHYSAFQVQKAIDSALTADTALIAILGDGANGVVNNPTQCDGLTLPYIVIGDHTAASWNTKSKNGAELTITIHVFSQSGDNEQACDLLDRIIGIIDKRSMAVSGNHLVQIRWDDFATVMIDDTEERLTFHGVARFRAITTEQ